MTAVLGLRVWRLVEVDLALWHNGMEMQTA